MQINRKKADKERRGEVDLRCAQFEALCRAQGIRMTPQRLAIYRALAQDPSHPTAESLYKKLGREMPAISPATVYRTLEFFEAKSLIKRVSGPESIGRFDANISPHQHLLCRICGHLSDVIISQLSWPTLPTVSGFTVEELDIRLVGRCYQCSKSTRRNRRRPVSEKK
jgi:Fur family peroxide stress response transcriptional regulator